MAKVTTSGEGERKTTTVELDFKGFYKEENIGGIKAVDGIYVAHACTLHKDADGVERCTPLRVIYIGMGTGTDNVHVRVARHKSDDHLAWNKDLNEGEHILYSYAECPTDIVHDVEVALIYKNKPKENEVSKDSYTGNTHLMTITSTGCIGKMKSSVTVI
ncbi:MAG: hypothetical protein K6A98_02410 [Prevotella sp.]|nr:hypothetical protein [Prevotella sp.]